MRAAVALLATILVSAGCLQSPPAEPEPLYARDAIHIAVHAEAGAEPADGVLEHLRSELADLLGVPVTVDEVRYMAPIPDAGGSEVHERHHKLDPDADLHVMYLAATAPGSEEIAITWAMRSVPVVVIWHDTLRAAQQSVSVFPDAPDPLDVEAAALLHGAGHRFGLTPCPLGEDERKPWCERTEGDSVMRWEVANLVGRIDAARDGLALALTFDEEDRANLDRLRGS